MFLFDDIVHSLCSWRDECKARGMGTGWMSGDIDWKSGGYTDLGVRDARTGSQEDALTGRSGIH